MPRTRTLLPLALVVPLLLAGSKRTDDLDRFIPAQMARRQIPGLSLAIIQDGKIVEARVPLDGNVNEVLTSWNVSDNAFTAAKPVTLRGILSHTAGLTVHGFPGYAMDQPVATLVPVLDGSGPANTAPIRVDTRSTR